MDNWLKWAIPIAAGAGLLATGGMAAPALGLLAGEGAGVGAAGAAGAAGAEAATAGALGAGAAEAGAGAGLAGATDAAALGASSAAPSAMAFVTPPVTSGLLGGGGELSGTLAGTDLAYGSPAALAEAPSVAPPTMMEQLGGYAKQGGKAASTYGMVNGAMGGNAPQRPPPQARPVFQGQPQPIAQQSAQPQQNQYALALLEQQKRARGMLG